MSLNTSYSNTRLSQERPAFSRGGGYNAACDGMVRCRHCSKVLPIEDLEEHELLLCPLKQLRCPHMKASGERCGFLCSGQEALMDHCKTCKNYPAKRRSQSKRSIVAAADANVRAGEVCEDCQQAFPDRAELAVHAATCLSKHVPCPLRCGRWLPRGMVPEHILTTADAHVPLRRPSVSDYGGDNIHMVVAVLMEVVQRLKTELRESTAATGRSNGRRTPNTPPSAVGGEVASAKAPRELHLRPGDLEEGRNACVAGDGGGADSACSVSSIDDGVDEEDAEAAAGYDAADKGEARQPASHRLKRRGKGKVNGGTRGKGRKSPSAEIPAAYSATSAAAARSEDIITPPSPPRSVRLKSGRARASVGPARSTTPRASSSSVPPLAGL